MDFNQHTNLIGSFQELSGDIFAISINLNNERYQEIIGDELIKNALALGKSVWAFEYSTEKEDIESSILEIKKVIRQIHFLLFTIVSNRLIDNSLFVKLNEEIRMFLFVLESA